MVNRPLYEPLLAFVELIGDQKIIIEDRDTSVRRPLIPTPGQEELLSVALEQASRGEAIKQDIPKARKYGVSTIIQAIFVVLAEIIPGRYYRTYAHTDIDAKVIFRLGQSIYTNLTGRKVDSLSKIEYPNGSIYECSTFSGRGTGRGGTPHGIHLSELAAAVSPNGADSAAIAGLLNALPDAPHTMLFCESTGNGPFGAFYDRCNKARDKISNSKLIFLPWFKDPGYTKPVPENFVPTDSEKLRMRRHGLTPGQIVWYRHKLADQPGEQYMRKEFPETLEDCWACATGLVYPTFSSSPLEQGGNVGELEITSDWSRGRSIDWAFSQFDYFVCLWIAHLRGAPPGLVVHPSCKNLINEFQLYARDDKNPNHPPKDEHNHSLDALRQSVVTSRLTGLVYVYRELALKPCLSPADAAMRIHEMSGWVKPKTGADDFGNWNPGPAAEKYAWGVADRSQPGLIRQFNQWRISPLVPQKTPVQQNLVKSAESKDEIEDGIAIVLSLISKDARMMSTFETPLDRATQKLIESQSGPRPQRARLTEGELRLLNRAQPKERSERTRRADRIVI